MVRFPQSIRPGLIGLAFLVPGLAQAPVQITGDQGPVPARFSSVLRVAHQDGLPHRWKWDILGHAPDQGYIMPIGPDQALYTAGAVPGPRQFQVQAADLNDPTTSATFQITVCPGPEAQGGGGWLHPGLFPIAGKLDGRASDPAGPFGRLSAVRFIDDPELGPLDQQWVAADPWGIRAVSGRGELTWLAGARPRPDPDAGEAQPQPGPEAVACTALAVRPRGSAADNPRHLVFAQQTYPFLAGGDRVHRGSLILDRTRDGRVEPLAGSAHELGYQDGTGPEARFGPIRDLAIGRQGEIYALDPDNSAIRRIAPDGVVTTLAGRPRAAGGADPALVDGPGATAQFGALGGLVLDPDTGDLYVTDTHTVRRITPAGLVSTVLGAPGASGYNPSPARPDPGAPCLDSPTKLALRGRELLISDTGNNAIRVFNLDTRLLVTLVGGGPHARGSIAGPIPYLNPGLPRAALGAVCEPGPIAVAPEGVCVVGLGSGLAQLDLPPGTLTPAGPAPARPDPPVHPAQPAPPTQLATTPAAAPNAPVPAAVPAINPS